MLLHGSSTISSIEYIYIYSSAYYKFRTESKLSFHHATLLGFLCHTQFRAILHPFPIAMGMQNIFYKKGVVFLFFVYSLF